MKKLFCIPFLLLFVPFSLAADKESDPGVLDDSCHEDSKGDITKVEVDAQTMGDQKIKFTDKDGNTGTTVGTPDDDGGCADSDEVFVGGVKTRIRDGKVQERDSDGKWKNSDTVNCPKDPEEADELKLKQDDTIGGWPVFSDLQ